MGLKALSSRHGTLPYNTQIFAGISSLIALEISSSRKTTFYTHVKKALGKQPLHASKHKQARDIVNGYYDNTDSFAALPTATFRLIFGASIATRRRFKLCTIGSSSDAMDRPPVQEHHVLQVPGREGPRRESRPPGPPRTPGDPAAWASTNTWRRPSRPGTPSCPRRLGPAMARICPACPPGEDLPSMSARPKAK
jgi:hypothetical protein